MTAPYPTCDESHINTTGHLTIYLGALIAVWLDFIMLTGCRLGEGVPRVACNS